MDLAEKFQKNKRNALSQRILAEFQALEAGLPEGPEKDRLRQQLQDAEKQDLNLEDLMVLEKSLLSLYSEDVLRRKTWQIREQFRITVGEEMYRKQTGTGRKR